MAIKRPKPEEIVVKLWQVEVLRAAIPERQTRKTPLSPVQLCSVGTEFQDACANGIGVVGQGVRLGIGQPRG